ncbi:MAG TPA: hypothetical protein VFU02_00480 [Polyangiaceae bacterium]|nr:hypothetical protein [Polyangiaceae bacterium]
MKLSELEGTEWEGGAELWLDPLGDSALRSSCTLSVAARGLRYTWQHEGRDHAGSVRLFADRAEFTDTWHQPEVMQCRYVPEGVGLFQVRGQYGPDADWGWRIGLSFRAPTAELVLQMTNITPWGEEARAVRMVAQRK